MIYRFSLLSVVMLLAIAMVAPHAQAEDTFITIGTGNETGVYFPAGGAICRLVNRGRKEHGIRCAVESTGGSIFNLSAVNQHELDFGIAQSDWHYNAYKGQGLFSEQGPDASLRSVFSLHSEAFTVVVRADSAIRSFDDLKGKIVNVGSVGSGMRAMMQELLKAKGWSDASITMVDQVSTIDQAHELCGKKVEAIVFAAGHPNGSIQDVTSACASRIIPVDGPAIDALIKQHPYYALAIIPGGMYQGNSKDIKTFGVKATLITSEDTSDDAVYQVVKAVFDNFDSFKTLHFVFQTLSKDMMVKDGLIAPLHPGALRYYREVGLVK